MVWLLIAGAAGVRSQNTLGTRVQQIEQRARQTEETAQAQRLALEVRLAKLELQLEAVVLLLKGVVGAVGVHLVSSFAGLLIRRKGGNDGD